MCQRKHCKKIKLEKILISQRERFSFLRSVNSGRKKKGEIISIVKQSFQLLSSQVFFIAIDCKKIKKKTKKKNYFCFSVNTNSRKHKAQNGWKEEEKKNFKNENTKINNLMVTKQEIYI